MPSRNKERENVNDYKKCYEQGRADEKSFSYNSDKNNDRKRGRPPLKEVKSEKSNENINSFSLDFALDTMLLM